MSNPTVYEEVSRKSYEELTANFDWAIAERELGYKPGDPINIGWMCSDRICHAGMADKVALYWEDFQGNSNGSRSTIYVFYRILWPSFSASVA